MKTDDEMMGLGMRKRQDLQPAIYGQSVTRIPSSPQLRSKAMSPTSGYSSSPGKTGKLVQKLVPIGFKTRDKPVARVLLEYKVDVVQDSPMMHA